MGLEQLRQSQPQFALALAGGMALEQAVEKFGFELLKQKRQMEAAQLYYIRVVDAPEKAGFWASYGTALDQCGLAAEAVKCFEASVKLDPRQADNWLLTGFVRKKIGDLPGCEAAYRRAISLEPAAAIYWQCLGLLKQEQREYSAAIECFEMCLKCGDDSAVLHANLGRLYYETGRLEDSHSAYLKAGGREPGNAHFQEMIRRGNFMMEVNSGGKVDEALSRYLGGDVQLQKSEQGRQLLMNVFGFFTGYKYEEAAMRVGKKYLELWPDSAEMDYLLKAAAGGADFERAPSKYVASFFDSFAAGFNAKLVGSLGYDVPSKLMELVRRRVGDAANLDVLDAGCGTGLSGPLLKPVCKSLAGVDLSQKMLEQAAGLKVYDSLDCAEISEYLEKCVAQYDLIVAADMLIYFGDLRRLFGQFHRALRPGGLLACSTEKYSGEGHKLLTSGRFAHSVAHVRAAAADFGELDFCETTIRLEANKPVTGNLYVFGKV